MIVISSVCIEIDIGPINSDGYDLPKLFYYGEIE